MDAFENVISMLLRREGYWATTSFQVDLTKEEKRRIGKASSPRWELDVVAHKGSTNEVLVVECKSFLDSTGVIFRGGTFEPENRYKLFTNDVLRSVVFEHLAQQLQSLGACVHSPHVRLCLAAGRIARKSDSDGLRQHFTSRGWLLFDSDWIRQRLRTAAGQSFENDVVSIASKLLLRADTPIIREVVEQLKPLPQDLQRRVLKFVRSLARPTPRGVRGRELRHLAGTISSEDAERMREAIEEGCEREGTPDDT